MPVRHLLPYSSERPDTSPQRFVRINSAYYDAVVEGRKTATTRLRIPAPLDRSGCSSEFDEGYKRLPGHVESIVTKRFDELTDADAQMERGAVAGDLREGLRGHYRGNPGSLICGRRLLWTRDCLIADLNLIRLLSTQVTYPGPTGSYTIVVTPAHGAVAHP
jgi:hypothetical protein